MIYNFGYCKGLIWNFRCVVILFILSSPPSILLNQSKVLCMLQKILLQKAHWISSQLIGDSNSKILRMMNFQSLMHTRKPPFVMLQTPSLTDRTVTISTFKYAQCSSFRTSLNPLTALFKRPKNSSFKVIIACEHLDFLDIFQWFNSHFCGFYLFIYCIHFCCCMCIGG